MAKTQKNAIEKQKNGLIGLGIAVLVFGMIAIAGGIVLTIFGSTELGNKGVSSASGWIMLVLGIILIILSLVALICGIRVIWIASALKATRGSIAEGNIPKECGTPNGIKCPKCGATNTPDVTECQVCHSPLK